jgi:trimethylamine:corrinoid methyltransferase-like protein
MLDGRDALARRGQPVIVTPFTLSGRDGARDDRGAVAQQTAEALCAIALLQCVRSRRPWSTARSPPNVDMKSGAPAFGTPEIHARHADLRADGALLWPAARASNACAANAPDAQAAWESAFLAVGLRHRNGQHRLPFRRLAGRRADRSLREVRHRLRDAAAGRHYMQPVPRLRR